MLLEEMVSTRQARLSHVLDVFNVPDEQRDVRNALCGLRNIKYMRSEHGAHAWMAAGLQHGSLASAMRAAGVECSHGSNDCFGVICTRMGSVLMNMPTMASAPASE